MKTIKKKYMGDKKRIAELESHKMVAEVRLGFDEYVIHNNIEYLEVETLWIYLKDGYLFNLDCSTWMCLSVAQALKDLKTIGE